MQAAVFIDCDCFSLLPVGTSLLRVYIQMRLASEVLPSVSVNAILCIVFGLWIGTPHCFKVEVVKINVCFKFVDEIDGQLGFSVCKRAVVSVIAFTAYYGSAKLCPVFVRVVELFNTCVTVNARISLWTLFFLSDITAKLRFVSSWRSSSVFSFLVICWAHFEVVAGFMIRAQFCLESVQIQNFDPIKFVFLLILSFISTHFAFSTFASATYLGGRSRCVLVFKRRLVNLVLLFLECVFLVPQILRRYFRTIMDDVCWVTVCTHLE